MSENQNTGHLELVACCNRRSRSRSHCFLTNKRSGQPEAHLRRRFLSSSSTAA